MTGQQNATHWNMEDGYDDSQGGDLSLNLYPNRVLSTGPLNGLHVQPHLSPAELDYMCQGPVRGFNTIVI